MSNHYNLYCSGIFFEFRIQTCRSLLRQLNHPCQPDYNWINLYNPALRQRQVREISADVPGVLNRWKVNSTQILNSSK